MAIRDKHPADANTRAFTQFQLARVLWDAGDRKRAIELATASAERYRSAGDEQANSLKTVEDWLARHEP